MGTACTTSADQALSKSVTTLRTELAAGLKGVDANTDSVRCAAMTALESEVKSRQDALKAAAESQASLGADIRAELAQKSEEVSALARSLSEGVDRRVDNNLNEIKTLSKDQ